MSHAFEVFDNLQAGGFHKTERLDRGFRATAEVRTYSLDSLRMYGRMTDGVERAQEANRSIKQIGEESRNAVAMVTEIASAIREQGSATNNIATQVERIAQMSEESSAAAGNSAQTAQDLDRLATDMQRILGMYRL